MRKVFLFLLLLTVALGSNAQSNADNLKVGQYIRYNLEILEVKELTKSTAGGIRAFFQVKLFNPRNGTSFQNRFRPGDPVDILNVTRKELLVLQFEGNEVIVEDEVTSEQTYISSELFINGAKFLKPGSSKVIVLFDGDTSFLVSYLPFYVLTVKSTTPPTSTGKSATATLETGDVVDVPSSIKTGDKLKIDARIGAYLEKVQ